jgi:hypothetical protein
MGRGGLRGYKSETRVECNVRVIYRRLATLENEKFIFQKFYKSPKILPNSFILKKKYNQVLPMHFYFHVSTLALA